jgi:hypothetical protein
VTDHPHDTGQEACGDPPPRPAVAIIPGSARLRHPELIRALEEAYAVRFVGSSGSDIDGAAAVIVFPGGRRPEGLAVPCLVLKGRGATEQPGSSFAVQISRDTGLDRALHGQTLVEDDRSAPAGLVIEPGCRVLALAAGKPIWMQSESGGVECVTAGALPAELEDGEFLRAHLTAGRFWSLLPIVHFLKRLSPPSSESHRACFVIDDPNLRLTSYGYLRFPDLARDARECDYHVAVATIPLDLTFPGRRAVALFREFRSQLSLAVHGNDHVRRELERPHNALEAERIVGSAAARVARFEERAGIRIDRVMCPPHGGCGEEAMAALFRCGFLALAASRPFPWDGFADHRNWRLGGWVPAQLAGGGLPVIPRYSLSQNLDDLVFRAMLGLPLIVYCHHTDLRNGLEPFRRAAAQVASLGEVTWSSLASITRGNARWHERDGVATVTLYSRDVRIPRPAAPVLRVELPRILGAGNAIQLAVDGETHDVTPLPGGGSGVVVPNTSVGAQLRIQMFAPGRVVTPPLPERRPRVWPIARRTMTETRDRALPIIRDLRRSRSRP